MKLSVDNDTTIQPCSYKVEFFRLLCYAYRKTTNAEALQEQKEVDVSLNRQLLCSLLVVLALTVLAAGCSSEGSTDTTDGDSDVVRIPCDNDDDCVDYGMMCSVVGFCIDMSDGDGFVDGDWEEEIDVEVDMGIPEERKMTCPSTLEFGMVTIGDSETLPVSLENIGSEDIVINTIRFASDEEDNLEMVDLPSFPYTLRSGTSMTFSVTYHPVAPGDERASITIASNAYTEDEDLCQGKVNVTSEYGGDSSLVVYPENLTFGNVGMDDPAMELPVLFCNIGTGNKVITFSGARITGSDADQFDYSFQGTEPSYNNPLFVPPGDEPTGEEESTPDNCQKFYVSYDPDEMTNYPNLHEGSLDLYNDADTTEGDSVSIPLVGSSDPNTIYVSPKKIDFGEVDINTTDLIPLTIQNQTGGSIEITEMSIDGMDCIEFGIVMPEGVELPMQLTADEIIENVGVTYTPDYEGLDEKCDFVLMAQRQCAPGEECPEDRVTTDISGYGRVPNQKPVANVSRSALTLESVDMPIEDVAIDQRLYLYGRFSSDEEDGGVSRYKWELIAPETSSLTDVEPDDDMADVSIRPDVAGTYLLSLTVWDSVDAVSEPKQITINVGGGVDADRIIVDMEFSGQDDMSVQLEWIAPNTFICSDATMSPMHVCNLGDYGRPVVTKSTLSFQYDGNHETIMHNSAPDGTYKIKVTFLEDCGGLEISGWCLNPQTSDVTIRIYIGEDVTPTYTRQTTLDGIGDFEEWAITKGSEGWSTPYP